MERTPAGVFLSHSSKDKLFVTRLAIDLLKQGIPVWFDKWEIDIGDSLLKSIKNGISESMKLILVLSNSSLQSDWVNSEIKIGLAKEKLFGSPFLIPITIDDCEVPSLIADRVYADFRDPNRYHASLERLTLTLVRSGAADLIPSPENELIAFEIYNGINLLTSGLKARLNKVLSRIPNELSIREEQLVFGEEPEYLGLKAHCQQLLSQERSATGESYDSEKHNDLEELNQDFNRYDRVALEGLVEILNGLKGRKHYDPECIAEACFWFLKEVRCRVIERIRMTAGSHRLKVTPEIEWLWKLQISNTYSSQSACKFYKVDELLYCAVWIPGQGRVYKVSLDQASSEAKDLLRYGQMAGFRLTGELMPWTQVKYVIPSMVYDHYIQKHFSISSVQPFNWNLSEYHIGLD